MRHFSDRVLARSIRRLTFLGLLASCSVEPTQSPTVEGCGALRSRDAIYYASRMEYRFMSAHGLAQWRTRPKVHIDAVFQRADAEWRLLGQVMAATGFAGGDDFPAGEASLSIIGFVSSSDCRARSDPANPHLYACPPGGGLYNHTQPLSVSSAARTYDAHRNTPSDSTIALAWFPSADRRDTLRRNAQGFLIVDTSMQILEASCFINVDLPQAQIAVLYRECLLRTFGLVEFSGPGGPRILQARGAVRPDWSIAGWDVALACLTSLYSDTIFSEEAY